MALVMGVDSSTQSCKVVVVDAETGKVVRGGRASHPAGTSVAPEAWWKALQDAIAQAGGLDDVAAVSIAGQQHGMVVLDAEGAVHPRRSAVERHPVGAGRARPHRRGGRRGVRRAHGSRAGRLVHGHQAPLVARRRARQRRARRRRGPAARLADLASARVRPGQRRSRGARHDRSDASGTYWGADGYDLDLFRRALGRDAVLPRVLGPWESAGALHGGALVGPGAGDNAGAALGLGAGVGDVVVSLGTSGTVFAVTDAPAATRRARWPASPTPRGASCRSWPPSTPPGARRLRGTPRRLPRRARRSGSRGRARCRRRGARAVVRR